MKKIYLAIEHGGIVACPEKIEQILIAALLGIELNPNHLRMVRRPRANVAVTRIVQKPLAVPDLRLRHARNPLESQLHAPEAAGAELRELLPRRRDVVVGALRDGGGGGRVRGGGGPAPEP